MNFFDDVLHWHRKLGQPVGTARMTPEDLDSPSMQLGIRLIREEYQELEDGLEAKDVVAIVDACADLIWVLCGFLVRGGIDLVAVWLGVKRANYAKVGGPVRGDGKILKPVGWTPPCTASDIRRGRYLATIHPISAEAMHEEE